MRNISVESELLCRETRSRFLEHCKQEITGFLHFPGGETKSGNNTFEDKQKLLEISFQSLN